VLYLQAHNGDFGVLGIGAKRRGKEGKMRFILQRATCRATFVV